MHNKPHSDETRALISAKKKGIPLLSKRKEPKILDGIKVWKCPTCQSWLPESDYFPKKRAWNGISSQCRKCYSQGNMRTRDREKHRATKRESAQRCRERNPEKFRAKERARPRRKGLKVDARQIVHLALRIGAIKKPKVCEDCQQRKRLTAHHEDYLRPLDVNWLCYLCHAQRHRK